MSPKVCSKLDRAMVNPSWLSSNFMGIAEFVAPGCISDHAMVLVSCFDDHVSKRKRPFKFFNMWTLSDNFLNIVGRKWVFNGWGSAQYKFKRLMVGLKAPLKCLNVKQFSHISARADKAKQVLIEAQ